MNVTHRKSWLTAIAALALSPLALAHNGPESEHLQPPPDALSITALVTSGSGVNTYQSVPNWCQTPTGRVDLGSPTHGGVVVDKAGLIYISMDGGPHGILVYGADGKMVRGIADKYTGIHGLMINDENGEQFLYGARNGHADVLKLKLDGTVVWTIGIPLESGKYDDPKAPAEKPKEGEKPKRKRAYNPTGVAVAPNGHVFVVDGYGQNWCHEFDENQKYVKSFGGPGKGEGQFATCHGISLDTRTGKPLLLISDRANGRLQHFDLDGKFVDIIPLNPAHRPCCVSILGQNVAIAELDGRVEILDGTNKVVSVVGENTEKGVAGVNGAPVEKWKDGIFTAPHGVSYDKDGNLYVEDWNKSGRISKMVKVAAAARAE